MGAFESSFSGGVNSDKTGKTPSVDRDSGEGQTTMGKEIGHHEGFRRDHDAKIGSERNFGLTIGTICAVVALIRWYNHEWDVDWLTATLIASALGLVGFGLIWPTALKPLNIIWMRFGLLLYRVINPLALGLIFFVAVDRKSVV